MSAAAPLFKQVERRDDLALLEVLRGLPKRLRDGVNNPVNENESLTKRLGVDELEVIASAYEDLTSRLTASLAAKDPQTVCNWLRADFGARLPDRPDLVTDVTPVETISAIPTIISATPLVGRTQAGK